MTRLVTLALILLLGGCGLRPLYQGGSHGVVAQTLSGVEVGPIAGQAGWLMRNALNDRLGRTGGGATRYRLDVLLDDQVTGFGIRSNNTVTRERRTLRARYKLVDLSSQAVLLDATAGSDAGIDVVTSEYAVIAAEQTALERLSSAVADQILARIALYAARNPAPHEAR
ncbi:LPS assembly lipoprotein LptE [uncultured Sphingomonas sp.]|uniref:LPS assembly lipoprotein LptE n=1 Tax=uncultured Sphingomonas sp. TaxID=158754 RepID=UPI0025FDB2C0|nr:LPS assembly lipoprotein LptE [uncultured Sphingomonas sp.]